MRPRHLRRLPSANRNRSKTIDGEKLKQCSDWSSFLYSKPSLAAQALFARIFSQPALLASCRNIDSTGEMCYQSPWTCFNQNPL